MAGMLQIITYLLCFYLVIKGIGVLQVGLASGKQGLIVFGGLTLAACVVGAIAFANFQDEQARSMSERMNSLPTP